jgi:hypothetical protein
MASTPIYNWPTPDNTGLVKNGALDMRSLGNAIDTTMGTMVPKTIVDAKGDLIAATAADTTARLAVGANGETLVADSSTSTGLRYQAIQTRNCTYNSAMDIWQRGTSFTATGFTADRWQAVTAGIAGRTISRVAGTGQFQYLTRIQRTAGNTATNGVDYGQPFEIADATPYAGKTVTLSFYARKGADWSASSSNLLAYVFSGTSSTETNRVTTAYPSGGATPLSGNATLTTTLQRFQYTFTFGATVTQFAFVFSVGFTGTAGAADYVDITGVQLEVGSVATDYVRQGATIQGELSAAQRYYYRATSAENAFTRFGGANGAGSTTSVLLPFPHPVTMRTRPTAVDFGGTYALSDGNGTASISNIGLFQGSSAAQSILEITCSGATQFRPYIFIANNSTTTFIGVTAEL